MPHGIETMAWTGQPPWHGLGEQVEPNLTPEQMLKAAHLDWEVKKVPLFSQVEAPNGELIYRPVDGQYNLVRSTDYARFSTVGRNYVPTQNAEAFDFFTKFVKAGSMRMETAGSLHGGKYIWALANINYDFELPGDDVVKGYVLLVSPHVLGQGLTVRHTSIRVVCNNTLIMALHEAGAKYRLPHVKKFDERAHKYAEQALGLGRDISERFEEQATFLSEKRAGRDSIKEFMVRVFDDRESKKASNDNRVPDLALANRTAKLAYNAVDKQPGRDLASSAGTWWGAFNAVTYVIDHQLSTKNRDIALANAWIGGRAVTKQRALKLALDYAKAA